MSAFNVMLAPAAAAAVAVAAVLFELWRRRTGRRWRVRVAALEETAGALRRDLELAADARSRLEVLQANLMERVVLLESRRETGGLDEAICGAQRGARAPQIAERFGLSRGEADLLVRLHGVKRRA